MKRVWGWGSLLFICGALSAPAATATQSEDCSKLLLESLQDPFSAQGADRILQLARRHLEAQGVQVASDVNSRGNPILRIVPLPSTETTKPHLLNRLACTLWQKHGTQLIYDPLMLAQKKAVASFIHGTNDRPGAIRLPTNMILRPNRIDSSIAHEIMHSLTDWHLRRKDVYAFYGSVEVHPGSEANEIPFSREKIEAAIKERYALKPSYSTHYAFDEIQAHYSQVKRLLSSQDFALAKERAVRGVKLCYQTLAITEALMNALVHSPEKIFFNPHRLGGTEAIFEGIPLEGALLRIRIPLVRSPSTIASENFLFLVAQIKLLATAAEQRTSFFIDASTR